MRSAALSVCGRCCLEYEPGHKHSDLECATVQVNEAFANAEQLRKEIGVVVGADPDTLDLADAVVEALKDAKRLLTGVRIVGLNYRRRSK